MKNSTIRKFFSSPYLLIPIFLSIAFTYSEATAGHSAMKTFLQQQENDITVSGQIMSDENEPLPGANVVIKGTTDGTVTDIEGNYAIDAPEDGILVFSYVGYVNQEIPINGQSVINISLPVMLSSWTK